LAPKFANSPIFTLTISPGHCPLFVSSKQGSIYQNELTENKRMARNKSQIFNQDPAHFITPNRREFLRVGFLGGVGLTLGDMLRVESAFGAEPEALPQKAKSVIYIMLQGGMSHFETFDPKPNAPVEYRGELGVVKTKSGDEFGGLMKQTAGIADKIAVIRSFTHSEAAHERGTHNMLTGYRPNPALVFPSMGSVVSHEYGPRKNLPPYVCVPGAGEPFLGPGYLSSAFGPFSVGGEPNDKNFSVRDLNLPAGVDENRMNQRRTLLASVDEHFKTLEKSDSLAAMDTFYQRAYALISSKEAREAFNITAEDGKVRDEYGRNGIGQRLLMARRLVEAGVRFVSVMDGGWDMHVNVHGAMQGRLPSLDQGYAALIRDLDQRGLLKDTLVVLATEFGRTPKINKDRGRDHWPKVFSVAMAGGGIKGGEIYGASDGRGTEPQDKPVGPGDFGATIFTLMGIDPVKELMSPGNRPIEIIKEGKLVPDLIA
jgi:hypothetical protein